MAGLLNDAVEQTLREWSHTAFEWGESDCALAVFKYLKDHCDVPTCFERWAGVFGTEKEVNKFLNENDGPLAVLSTEMVRAGLKRTRSPKRGDVGAIRDAKGRMVTAICVGDGFWAARTRNGFASWKPRYPMAWSVKCQRR